MLTITDEAASAIEEIVAEGGLPKTAGVWITTGPGVAIDGSGPSGLHLELAPGPADGDEVLERAPVFVEHRAALLLDDKLLDAEASAEGTEFALRDR